MTPFRNNTHPFMVTQSGVQVPLLAPEAGHIRIRDIAVQLARINRFNGCTSLPYSVAQHSVHCAEIVARHSGSPVTQLRALLHDAHEAYTGDITTPMKRALAALDGALDIIEQGLDRAIMRACGLAAVDDDDRQGVVERADREMLAAEWRDLMPDSGWSPEGPAAPMAVKPWGDWSRAAEKFLREFTRLAAIANVTPLESCLL